MKRNIETVARLLFDFSNSLDKRSPIFLVIFDEVLPQILEWDLTAWRHKWLTEPENRDRAEWINWVELSHMLGSIVEKIGERAIEAKQDLFSTCFLKFFHTHVNLHKNEQVLIETRPRYYLEDLFRIFYKLVFGKVAGSDESNYFWEVFPDEWKVRKSNIVGGNSFIPLLSWNEFQGLAEQKIRSGTEDLKLNDVMTNLFPEIEPRVWSIILLLVFASYDPENRTKSVIERDWNRFGFSFKSHVFSFSGEPTKEAVEAAFKANEARKLGETQNAYELAHLLFRGFFTEELLKQCLKETNELQFDEKSPESRKKLKLLEVLEGLMANLKKE
jgi:hypothetical protein